MSSSPSILELTADDDAAALPCRPGVSPIDARSWQLHRPTAHFAAMLDDHCAARCSIWATNTPRLDGEPVGLVGHYAAVDAAAGTAVLLHATAQLSARGHTTIVGPMDGSTWHRYRLLTDRGAEPPFFLEPDNPDDWPTHFAAAGFTPLATYTSALNDDLSITDPRVPQAWARLEADGISIRCIDLDRFEDELRAVHALSVKAFAGNFLYTPITAADFLAMYAPLRPIIDPRLVLLAERDAWLVGFIFGLPDQLERQRSAQPRTVIAKSMAVRPGRSGAGLGSVLMDRFQQAARAAGYTRVIHALMHEDNRSRRISDRFGRTIRRYAVYARTVAP